MKLDPNALASTGDYDLDSRPEVQYVSEDMIFEYVVESGKISEESAHAFAYYLNLVWNDYSEGSDLTNRQVIEGASKYWRGR